MALCRACGENEADFGHLWCAACRASYTRMVRGEPDGSDDPIEDLSPADLAIERSVVEALDDLREVLPSLRDLAALAFAVKLVGTSPSSYGWAVRAYALADELERARGAVNESEGDGT
jgi:hypothetical protein